MVILKSRNGSLETLQVYSLTRGDEPVIGDIIDVSWYEGIIRARRVQETHQTKITDFYLKRKFGHEHADIFSSKLCHLNMALCPTKFVFKVWKKLYALKTGHAPKTGHLWHSPEVTRFSSVYCSRSVEYCTVLMYALSREDNQALGEASNYLDVVRNRRTNANKSYRFFKYKDSRQNLNYFNGLY